MRKLTLLICLLAAVAVAQDKGKDKDKPAAAAEKPAAVQENPYSAWNQRVYGMIQGILLRSAEKVPEADYGFRPAETVRTFGQIVGHVADSQYYFCSLVLGENKPSLNIEKTKSSKAELIAALKESSAYCDKAYAGMTDASGTQMVKLFGTRETPRLNVLNVNEIHDLEHYGNLVTYMRIKNIVPPTSEPAPEAQPKK
jgi:uncharacterized damage-inducible protein DinB